MCCEFIDYFKFKKYKKHLLIFIIKGLMELLSVIEDIKKVYIYTRVSTEKQVKGDTDKYDTYGLGMEAQVQICIRFYQDQIEDQLRMIPEIVSDVGSTFNDQGKMPKFDSMLESLPENSLILIVDVSRLGRNIYHSVRNYEIIEQKKSWLYSVNENKVFGKVRADDLFFFNKTIEAESFSLNKSSNTKAIFDIIRSNGGYVGGIPFGMKLERGPRGVHKLKRDSKQNMIIKKVITMYTRGIKVSDIEKVLANNPANNYRGKPITKSLISRTIRKYKLEQQVVTNEMAEMGV